MENYTLYSHSVDFDLLLAAVQKALPKITPEVDDREGIKTIYGTFKNSLFGRKSEFRINYRRRVSSQLADMADFVAAIPAKDKEVQNLLLKKIGGINSEVAFMAGPSMSADLQALLLETAESLDAIVFAQPGLSFSDSSSQHFLDKTFKLILDSQGNTGKGKIGVLFETRHLYEQGPASGEQLERKEKTIAFLQEKHIKVSANLPPVPDVASTGLREENEIFERAYGLVLMTAKGEGVEWERLEALRKDLSIVGLTPAEKSIYEKPVLEQQEKLDALWRYESLNVLLWSLGLMEALVYPSSVCDFSSITKMMIGERREVLEKRIRMRSVGEVLDELDKVYRMHWACVDARINQHELTGDLDPSVVYERHYSLKWVTRYRGQEWDKVTTDT